MLFENSYNKKEKSKNSIPFPSANETQQSGTFENEYDNEKQFTPEWNVMKERTRRKLDYLATPIDEQESIARFNNSFNEYMLPKDTPERHRKNYALSNEALDDIVSGYYNGALKPEFEKNREKSKKEGDDEYLRYTTVPGADPVNAYKASVAADDPMRVVENTMAGIDDEELMDKVAPLASYGGYNTKEYVDNFVKPSLRNRMIGEYVKENTPKSSAEYLIRSSLDNSLMGKMGAIGMNANKGARNNRMIASEGMANYRSNRLEDFAAGIGGLLVDMPIFSGLGSLSSSIVGRSTAKASEKLANTVLSRYSDKVVSKDFANAVADKVIKERLKSRIVQSAATQGLTLGGYDVANSVADDILYDQDVDMGKTIGAFARGFATGAAVGTTGTALKARTKGLTGGKKLLSSAGVLSAESAVFTAGTEFDKLAHGIKIEPIDLLNDFGESTATLLTMRLANWRPKGAMQKLNANGKLKSELEFSKSEKQEFREMNIDPQGFVTMLEKELRMPSLGSSDAKLLKESYATLMSNKNLSASAKSKLMYLVENKITSTPPVVFDYDVEQTGNGKWRIKMLDAGGRVVENLEFPNAGNAKSHLILQRGGIRKNRIAHYERELTSGNDSENFLHEAGVYAKEQGISADKVAEAMYKAAKKEQLDNVEHMIMEDITERSMHYESQINKVLSNARHDIEQRYNLDRGTLSYAVDKRFIDCSSAENKALDEYEAFVRTEFEKVKNRENDKNIFDKDDKQTYSNEENKRNELQEYQDTQKKKHFDQGTNVSVPSVRMNVIRNIPEMKPGYVWNIYGRNISEETIKDYEKRGKELAKSLGYDIEFITDEHQIKVPETDNANDLADYKNQLRASGWVNRGKVVINLPNIKDYADLESTIVHEVVGHVGLKKVFGNYMYDFLEDVYKTADGTVRNGIKKMEDKYGKDNIYNATEEYLVSLIEKAYPNAQERNVLIRFKDFIKSMLVRGNIYKSKYRRVSEDELQSIMKAHSRSMLNKKERGNHRKEVFNRFASAHLNEDGYYDHEAYARDKTEKVKDRSFTKYTPTAFYDAKFNVNYPYFPEEAREEIRKKSRMTDQELRMLSEMYNYRLDGEKEIAENPGGEYKEERGRNVEDAVSHYMLELENRLSKRYKTAQKYIAFLDEVHKKAPFFDNDAQIERVFEREYGVDMSTFKRMFPTYDDFLFYKLTGNKGTDNASKLSDSEHIPADSKERVRIPNSRYTVINSMGDLNKYFTGPLDIIENAVMDSDTPLKQNKSENSRLTPGELAELDNALDGYTKMLLRGMINGKKSNDPYGYESYSAKERARREFMKKEADEYRKKYENENRSDEEASSGYMNN